MKLALLLILVFLSVNVRAEWTQTIEPLGRYHHFVPRLGTFGPPNGEFTVSRFVDGKLQQKILFKFDEFGRRIVPQPDTPKKSSVLFFGNSEIFGDALDAADTLPAAFARRSPNAAVYNYAFVAHGPNHLWVQSLDRDYATEIKSPRNGWIVYVLFTYDVNRMFNDSRAIKYASDVPSLAMGDDGHLKLEGFFDDAHPMETRIYRWLDNFLPVVFWNRWFPSMPIYLPMIGRDRTNMACKALVESRDHFRAKMPDMRFVVVAHPRDGGVSADLVKCLKQTDLKVLFYGDLFDGIPYDRLISADRAHLSAYAHDVLADRLATDLKP